MEVVEEKPPEPRRERSALHRCRCLVLPIDRCPAMVSMDQPICTSCEYAHFGEHGDGRGTLVPLGQP